MKNIHIVNIVTKQPWKQVCSPDGSMLHSPNGWEAGSSYKAPLVLGPSRPGFQRKATHCEL